MSDSPDSLPKNTSITRSVNFDVVAIASSAGGFEPLMEVLSTLPSGFSVPILVVQHLSPGYVSSLPEVLGRKTKLRVKFAQEGERLQAGVVYVGVPNRHLLVNEKDEIRLSNSAQVNFTRPAADPLFISLALRYRERAIGIVLSGMGRDAATGIRAIAGAGGVTMVQEHRTCKFDGMPKSASKTGCVRFDLPASGIANTLISLVMVRGAATWLHAALPIG